MQTLKAMQLIAQAVELSDAGFPGDPIKEACRSASRVEQDAVLCIVQSRVALLEHPVTSQEVIAALRAMVRGEPPPALLASARAF